MLMVDGLEVAHGDLQVVWGISFSVPDNSIVAILGPNGAGKTTSLLALNGLLPAIGGTATFDGSPVLGVRTHRLVERGMVMIPEERGTFVTMSVEENLELGAYTRRARPDANKSMAEVFEIFPRLAERKRQGAGTLSGGERQMLAIGKALMAQPRLLILDEPSLGLAPIVVENTFEQISRIRESGVSILMVEQHVEMALEIADHAYIMEMGRMVGDGPASQLATDPKVREAYLSI